MGGAGHGSGSMRGLRGSTEAHSEEKEKSRWGSEAEKVGDAL